jgi:hypothetical protein
MAFIESLIGTPSSDCPLFLSSQVYTALFVSCANSIIFENISLGAAIASSLDIAFVGVPLLMKSFTCSTAAVIFDSVIVALALLLKPV